MRFEPGDVTAVRCRQRVVASALRWLQDVPACAIGPVAALWLIERVAACVAGPRRDALKRDGGSMP